MSWFSKLKSGLTRSTQAITQSISSILAKKKLDDAALEELEDALIMADLGIEAAGELVVDLRKTRFGKEVTDQEVREALANKIAEILEPCAVDLPDRADASPQVVLVAGVNGVGKTTTIGKIAARRIAEGRSVLLVAGDTFRAAAVEQLEVWGQRVGAPVVRGKPGCDAAGLAHDALLRAKSEGRDLVLIDTAGRLHNRAELMAELEKIVRVIKKVDPLAPHDALLVLDATTGQNAHAQVATFRSIAPISGLALTKLDGTAKGGVLVALAKSVGLPVHALGVGEGIDDLRPFVPIEFARALLGVSPSTGEAERSK